MAENNPPTANGQVDAHRGVPYYEKLRRDLRDSLQKKRIVEDNLARIDNDIMQLETRYLEETTAGNIIKGFDNYIKGTAGASTATTGGTSSRRRAGISEQDRIFSRSSVSVSRAPDSPAPSSTPSGAPTPSSAHPHGGGSSSNHPTPGSTGTATKAGLTKKKKKKAEDEDTDSKSNKRTKISYGRE